MKKEIVYEVTSIDPITLKEKVVRVSDLVGYINKIDKKFENRFQVTPITYYRRSVFELILWGLCLSLIALIVLHWGAK